jgi:hypothetical protein
VYCPPAIGVIDTPTGKHGKSFGAGISNAPYSF